MSLVAARVSLSVLIVVAFTPGIALAGDEDGILLDGHQGIDPGSIHLTWIGAPPNYSVYRALGPGALVDPPNQIGLTGFTSWDDSDFLPAGSIFYYEVIASCTPLPPEICDGLDNDCDASVDGPGSEASCFVPNATPQCVAGICGIASCDLGWGDCDSNAGDGCEAPLNMPQSTSPAAYAGAGDQDLQPGYVRVASIANCGGCGVSCDDGISCTTDLCLPSPTGSGQCGHYDRAQCAGARCPEPVLPPGTPAPTEQACAGPDTDGDGLSAPWEEPQVDPYTGGAMPPGIDLDCDGELSDADGDMIWHEAPAGPAVKDVYITIAGMGAAAGEPAGHSPSPGAVSDVVSAFAGAGITLHVDPNGEEVPHAQVVYLPVSGPVDACAGIPGAVSLHDSAYKGDPAVFDPRRRFGYHFFLFAHNSCSEDTSGKISGLAEIQGNDGIVSLADFPYLGTPSEIDAKKRREQAGTLMHELGHNFGLCHDGPADPNDPVGPCADSAPSNKPNQISVMSYTLQLNGILRSGLPGQTQPPDPIMPRRFDFSHETLDLLDETFLDEFIGIDAMTPPFDRDVARYYCPGIKPGALVAPASGPIDWNCDGFLDFPVTEDVNADGQLSTLPGASEWDGLFFSFQCQPTLEDGAQAPSRLARTELTLERAAADGLRAGSLLCGSGTSDCDGDDTNGCETPGFCSTAPTCSPDSLWSAPLGAGPASAAVSDTEFNPAGGSFSYLVNGNTAYSIYNVSMSGHPAGSINWTRSFASTLQNFPNPVLLQGGGESVFITGTNGFLYRLDASTGADQFPPFDTRRPICPLDQIVATPAVQLRSYSNAAFQSAQGDDLVFVITRTSCGDTANNRVFAVNAGSGTVAWIFNPTLEGLAMNYGNEGCALDYDTNTLYCGTAQAGAQHTLWAIDTRDGALKWSKNAGSILNRPQLGGSGRLYVATHNGLLRCHDATDGSSIWSSQVTSAANIVRNPAVVSGGPFDGLILVTDTAGALRAFLDTGSSGGLVWVQSPGPVVVTAPVVVPALGKAYVGRSDGRLQQVDLGTGAIEATAMVGNTTVFDPSLDFEGPGADINRLMAAAEGPTGGSQLRRYCIPWMPGSTGTQ